MSDTDFFALNQEQWFQEYVQAELSKDLTHTCTSVEKFEFEDVPF